MPIPTFRGLEKREEEEEAEAVLLLLLSLDRVKLTEFSSPFFFLLSYTTLHSTGDGRGEEGKLLLVGLKPRLRRQTDDRTDGQHELKYIALLRKSTLCLLGSSGGEKRVSFFFPTKEFASL